MIRIINITPESLKAAGFDGLVTPDFSCGCLADDLAPCGESPDACTPGYRGMSSEYPGDWAIFRNKAAADASMAAQPAPAHPGDEP